MKIKEKIDDTHLLDVHAIHSLVHAPDDGSHVACHLAHRHRGLYAAADRVDAARQPQQVKSLALLSDGILGVDACAICVALLEGLISRSNGRRDLVD